MFSLSISCLASYVLAWELRGGHHSKWGLVGIIIQMSYMHVEALQLLNRIFADRLRANCHQFYGGAWHIQRDRARSEQRREGKSNTSWREIDKVHTYGRVPGKGGAATRHSCSVPFRGYGARHGTGNRAGYGTPRRVADPP